MSGCDLNAVATRERMTRKSCTDPSERVASAAEMQIPQARRKTDMRKMLLAAGLSLACLGTFASSPASAWDAANCKRACDLTSANPPACYANIPCSKYAGRTHESESAVRAFAARFNAKQTNDPRARSIYQGKGPSRRPDRSCGTRDHTAGNC